MSVRGVARLAEGGGAPAGFAAGPNARFAHLSAGRMLIFDALVGAFRILRLGGARPGCKGCGEGASEAALLARCGIHACDCSGPPRWNWGDDGLPLSDQPAGDDGDGLLGRSEREEDAARCVSLLTAADRIRCSDFQAIMMSGGQSASSSLPVQLIDVRQPHEFATASIPGSINVPAGELLAFARRELELSSGGAPTRELVIVCRRGNESQRAVAELKRAGLPARDLLGGLRAWRAEVDPHFPYF